DYSNYDEYLPPEWRNGRWRESADNYRRDSRYEDRRNYRVPGDRRGNDARIVPYRYGDTRILSEPTITVQKIEEVLREYNSPAQGLGQLIFDLGVQHRINPAMALAFFVKESSAGTKGWAVKTNNWGNRKGTGPAGRAGPFMKYHSFEDSVKDWYPYIIRRYVNQGLDTLPTLIGTYAPNSDGNNEAGYVRAVMNMMRKWSV
ncbi:MAG TPA: glucosaminidase domain-containing protein, partial [Candidatus Melainabacteria bacterium]|nr:glucosaminidase domain-containing protein [Candidatus Melainabacteria bacterium]